MKRIKAEHWVRGGAAAGVLTALALVLWPLPAPTQTTEIAAAPFSGAIHQTRWPAEAGRSSRFQMAGGDTAEDVPVVADTPALVGIVRSGNRSTVYLRSTITGEVSGIRIGSELDGWRLIGAGARQACLSRGSDRQCLDLFTAAAPSG